MALGALAGRPLTEHVPDAAGAFQLHVHRDLHVWTWAAAVAITGELRRDLQHASRARLLCCGAALAAPVYHALAGAPLDWARVDIGLTDERWLQPDDPDSQAAMLRRTLLREHAAVARFELLTAAGRRLEDAVATANAHAQQAPSVAVLALGDDGQLAGLFPDAPDFGRALATRQAYMSFDAGMSAGAGNWPRRITITPAGLARARVLVLLMRGLAQRNVFELAMQGAIASRSPLAALRDAGAKVHAHWYP